MNEKELKYLKANLPAGYRKTISEETKLSIPYIDRVMRGDRYNQRIIDCIISLVAKTRASKKNSSTKVNRLMEGKFH